jgi:hypothetical protein
VDSNSLGNLVDQCVGDFDDATFSRAILACGVLFAAELADSVLCGEWMLCGPTVWTGVGGGKVLSIFMLGVIVCALLELIRCLLQTKNEHNNEMERIIVAKDTVLFLSQLQIHTLRFTSDDAHIECSVFIIN